MGGSQSSLDSYIKVHGHDSLVQLLLLRKKLKWLQLNCTRQINRKIDDQVKYLLFHMDQLINQKKQSALSQYKKTKTEILLKEPHRVKNCQEKHGKSLENIYGKNNLLDKLNLLKISFHVQAHILKKRIKTLVTQKITAIENQTFLAITNQFISKEDFEGFFKDQKKYRHLYKGDPLSENKLDEFRKQVVQQLDFDGLFWPYFDPQILKTEEEVTKVWNEVERNTKSMKKDLQGNWNIFKFQST